MIHLTLYKDSDCDLCKLMLHELIDNPPSCDVRISHFNKDYYVDENGNVITPIYPCTNFPTADIYDDDKPIARLEGFVTSKTINSYIKDYETKHLV